MKILTNKDKNKNVSRGRRYSPGERAQMLKDAESMGVAAAAAKHRSSKWTIYDWRKQDVRRAKAEQAKREASLHHEDPSGDQTDKVDVAEVSQDERYQLILEI